MYNEFGPKYATHFFLFLLLSALSPEPDPLVRGKKGMLSDPLEIDLIKISTDKRATDLYARPAGLRALTWA